MNMDLEKEKKEFVDLFKHDNSQFELTLLKDGFGFAIRKKIEGDDTGNISLITVYIRQEDIVKPEQLKYIYMRAYYGKPASEDGVYIRDIHKISEPVDITSDDYIYNISTKKLFIKSKEISGYAILRRFYADHIKPTRILRGLWVRTKLFYWHVVLSGFFKFLVSALHYILLLISGDRYTYEPVFSQEKLNGRIISSSLKELIQKEVMEEKDKKNKEIEFFGYKLDYWPIVVYSIINLFIYFYFNYINFKPKVLVKIIDNSFLALLYVAISIWLLVFVAPFLLRRFIRFNSKTAFELKYKKIKV